MVGLSWFMFAFAPAQVSSAVRPLGQMLVWGIYKTMHWSEIAAIILIVLCAIPILLLLRMLGVILWVIVTEKLQKQKQPIKVETPLGEFTKAYSNSDWEGFVQIAVDEAQIFANDINGEPDPNLLALVPSIITDLTELEAVARENVADLSKKHHFSSISSSDSEADFTLGFSYEEEAWGETVFVDFQGK